jgi:hypothetical protein
MSPWHEKETRGNVNEIGRKRENTENTEIKRLHVQMWGGGVNHIFSKGEREYGILSSI